MKNNKNKKKLLIIVLLLFAAIGVTGYGAYSYYWAEGSFRSYDDSIDENGTGGKIRTNKSFNPQGSNEYDEENDYNQMGFLGNGGRIKLTCSEEDNDGYRTCSGYSPVSNDGNISIIVSYSNFGLQSEGNVVDVSSITPTYKWVYEDDNGVERESSESTITLGENQSATLVTTFKIKVGTGSTAQQVTEPVIGSTSNLTMTIDIEADQYHSGY
jgi:hypothetical protein